MTRFANLFRLAVGLGVLVDWALHVPAIFAPSGASAAPDDLRWVAFASWLAVLVSWFYVPAAVAPYRYTFGAWVAVLGRAACAAVLLLVWRGELAVLGWVHLALFAVQLPLWLLALRERPRPGPADHWGNRP
jgi:hypothetical protein